MCHHLFKLWNKKKWAIQFKNFGLLSRILFMCHFKAFNCKKSSRVGYLLLKTENDLKRTLKAVAKGSKYFSKNFRLDIIHKFGTKIQIFVSSSYLKPFSRKIQQPGSFNHPVYCASKGVILVPCIHYVVFLRIFQCNFCVICF